jgi:predicted dehydrogenase
MRPEVSAPMVAPFEDNIEVMIKFESGAVGKLFHSWNTLNRTGGLQVSRIFGTEGNISFESNGLWALLLGRKKRFRVPGLLGIMGYRQMLQAFVRCVKNGKHPDMSLAVARRDLEVVFAAYRSLESGRMETVESYTS